MRIVDADWAPRCNLLVVECECGHHHRHRADRWRVECPRCRGVDRLSRMRERELAPPYRKNG